MLKKIRLQSLHLYSILEKTADRSMVPEMVMGVDYKGAQGNLQEWWDSSWLLVVT